MLFIQLVAIPLMVVLYLGIIIPLSIIMLMGWMFDVLGAACGFDTTYWPLSRVGDEVS